MVVLYFLFSIISQKFVTLAYKLKLIMSDVTLTDEETSKVNLVFRLIMATIIVLLLAAVATETVYIHSLLSNNTHFTYYHTQVYCLNLVLLFLIASELYSMYYLK